MLIGHLIEDKEDDYWGEKCQDCTKKLRVGDVAMVFDRGRAVFMDRDLIWHRRCIEYALVTAPLEKTQLAEAVEGIRQRGLGPLVEALGD